jgi:hypothetical protein
VPRTGRPAATPTSPACVSPPGLSVNSGVTMMVRCAKKTRVCRSRSAMATGAYVTVRSYPWVQDGPGWALVHLLAHARHRNSPPKRGSRDPPAATRPHSRGPIASIDAPAAERGTRGTERGTHAPERGTRGAQQATSASPPFAEPSPTLTSASPTPRQTPRVLQGSPWRERNTKPHEPHQLDPALVLSFSKPQPSTELTLS